MSPMIIAPECYSCLENLIELTIAAATADPDLQAAARAQAQAVLAREFGPQAIPACIANRFHPVIKAVTGNTDPFAARKRQETEMARQLAARLMPLTPADPPRLLALAAAGNALDFFRPAEEIARDMIADVSLPAADQAVWWERLRRGPGILLYLCDNAGEQFFDLPLVQFLRRRHWQVYYVVKGGPIQNDLTREDLAASGLADVMEPVVATGAATVGLELGATTPEFQELYAQADLILAKGMGHFETLAHSPDPRLFFLLQAKCRPVAAALGVPCRTFVLRQAGG